MKIEVEIETRIESVVKDQIGLGTEDETEPEIGVETRIEMMYRSRLGIGSEIEWRKARWPGRWMEGRESDRGM